MSALMDRVVTAQAAAPKAEHPAPGARPTRQRPGLQRAVTGEAKQLSGPWLVPRTFSASFTPPTQRTKIKLSTTEEPPGERPFVL